MKTNIEMERNKMENGIVEYKYNFKICGDKLMVLKTRDGVTVCDGFVYKSDACNAFRFLLNYLTGSDSDDDSNEFNFPYYVLPTSADTEENEEDDSEYCY